MVWIDNISDLEYFKSNQQYGCYGDPVFAPHDIILQAQYPTPIDLTATNSIVVNVLKPDGTFIEDASSYFDLMFANFVLNGVTYNYSNIRCNNYSPGMLSNVCFALEVNIYNNAGVTYFHKYTQKYNIISGVVIPVGVSVLLSGSSEGGSIATLCGVPEVADNCQNDYVELLCEFDCIDTFTGDYYGNGNLLGGSGHIPFSFARKSNIQGRIRSVPKQLKAVTSINGRTQRSETTPKLLLVGDVPFPVWKMEEIENMLLSNHIFINGKQYKIPEGITPFTQFGKPITKVYMYQLSTDIIDRFAWQTFGCTPICADQTYYYPIT